MCLYGVPKSYTLGVRCVALCQVLGRSGVYSLPAGWRTRCEHTPWELHVLAHTKGGHLVRAQQPGRGCQQGRRVVCLLPLATRRSVVTPRRTSMPASRKTRCASMLRFMLLAHTTAVRSSAASPAGAMLAHPGSLGATGGRDAQVLTCVRASASAVLFAGGARNACPRWHPARLFAGRVAPPPQLWECHEASQGVRVSARCPRRAPHDFSLPWHVPTQVFPSLPLTPPTHALPLRPHPRCWPCT